MFFRLSFLIGGTICLLSGQFFIGLLLLGFYVAALTYQFKDL